MLLIGLDFLRLGIKVFLQLADGVLVLRDETLHLLGQGLVVR